jgi:putative two-component system response regulator
MALNVVVADDDLVTLNIVANALTAAGHSVRLAADGLEAQSLIRESRPHVVFTDWNMPGCDGLELCRWIREHYASPYIYVIISTARGDVTDAVQALSMGADEYLRKPVEALEVAARVRAAERILSMESRHLTILALAKLAESRDPETGKHLERIGAYVRLLHGQLSGHSPYAREIDRLDVEMLTLTSTLHDVGKVGVPDSILLKPGRLNDKEYQMMKLHTDIGAEALRAVMTGSAGEEFLQMAHDIALSHHEHFDGQGYPLGLKGQDIPLVGRIVALADVYDALTSTRVYRPAMLHCVAHDLITQEAGKHFDPVMVDAYLSCEAGFQEIQERLAC